MKYSGLILISVFIGFISGCVPEYQALYNTAEECYKQQNYNCAIDNSLRASEINPDFVESKALLEDSYYKEMDYRKWLVSKAKTDGLSFLWDSVYCVYNASLDLNQRLMDARINLSSKFRETLRNNKTEFAYELQLAGEKAKIQHYNEGIKLMAETDIENQKNAAKQFRMTLQYDPNYLDAQQLYDTCKAKAIKRIAIKFDDESGKPGRYGNISNILVDDIVCLLSDNPVANEFINLIAFNELEGMINKDDIQLSQIYEVNNSSRLGKILNTQELIVGKINQILYIPERVSERRIIETQKVIVDHKITGKDDKGKPITEPIWGEVRAFVSIKNKTSKVQVTASFKVVDIATGKYKQSEICNSGEDFFTEWAVMTGGDPRALSNEIKNLCNRPEKFSSEDEMVNNAIHKLSFNIYDLIASYIK